MKLLLDMNLSAMWLKVLAEAGFEAVHWKSIGLANDADSTIMEFAVANEYVVMTHDLDFGHLLVETGASRPSVVQLRGRDPLPKAMAPQTLRALIRLGAELEHGALVTVDMKRIRISTLPLR